MNQERLIEDIIQKFKIEDCKPASTPLNDSIKLTKAMSPQNAEERKEMSNIPYSLVSSLIWPFPHIRI